MFLDFLSRIHHKEVKSIIPAILGSSVVQHVFFTLYLLGEFYINPKTTEGTKIYSKTYCVPSQVGDLFSFKMWWGERKGGEGPFNITCSPPRGSKTPIELDPIIPPVVAPRF